MSSLKLKYMSIRTKLICIQMVILAAVLVVVAFIVFTFLRNYFTVQQTNNLLQTREIIDSVLTESDFRTSSASSTLNTAAQVMDITIWICTSPESSQSNQIQVYCYGEDVMSQMENLMMMSDETAQTIRNVMDGSEMLLTLNAFPEIFESNTMSIGYQQEYVETITVGGQEVSMRYTGCVILNLSTSKLYNPLGVVFITLLIAVVFIAIIAMIVMFVLSNQMIQPIKEMQVAAQAIANGDFSKTITVQSHDEIGDLAESINKMTADLRELESMRSGFIANISHDFRSPLTSIRGFLQAMLDGTIPPEQYKKYMQIVLDETNRLTKMTNNILDLTKMENGQDEIVLTHFDINEMALKIAFTFEQRIEEKEIHMDFQFVQEKMYVNADFDKIERVLYNLIDNALKFTNQGDSIIIETSIVGQKAQICVRDTGVGIAEKDLPHIFERFNKGDPSRGNDKKGNGLGLTIVRQILLNHGEDITVRSRLGEGTAFTFTLPLAYKYNLVEKK